MEYEVVGCIDGHFGSGGCGTAETTEDVFGLIFVFLRDVGGCANVWGCVGY